MGRLARVKQIERLATFKVGDSEGSVAFGRFSVSNFRGPSFFY